MNNNTQQSCPSCRHMNPANAAICELCGFIFAKEGMTITYCPRSQVNFSNSIPKESLAVVGNEDETIAPPSFAISDDDATIMPEGGPIQNSNGVTNDPMAHFKIFDVLGKGGMGAIYKAQDLTLERFVALKLFYSQAAANSQTLLDEARLACKLNHPNIVTIYDIARGQNSNFIVMEWVNGQTLDQLIPEKGLAESKVLEFACQIAEGLACAHQNGIIHRDIKPQNIMLNKEGRIKILDFGIAELLRQSNKAASASEEDKETSLGDATRMSGLSGTPKYMAPEQARGEALDQQADIFSFGILLYEMLTGERPFHASSIKELRQELEKGSYRPLKEIHPHLSNEFVNIIDKMLAPNKAARWQTSAELVEALKLVFNELTQPKNWWQQRHWVSKAAMVLPIVFAIGWSAKEIVFPPTTQELVERQVAEAKKIAVLPLDNISGDPVLQLFSDGLITTLSSDLAVAGLEQGDGTTWVIPSSEIRRMKDVSVKAVSDKFGVDLVISGSIQHMGSTRSVVLNLINARDGRQLNTSELSIDSQKLFLGQDAVRQATLNLLGWQVSLELVDKFKSRRPQFDGAYKHYIQGIGYLYRYDIEENIGKAYSAFEKALEIDSRYENALVGIAESQLLELRKTKNAGLVERVQQTIKELTKINEDNDKIDFLSAELNFQTGDYQAATELYESAISKDAKIAYAYIGLARSLDNLGKIERAELTFSKAIEFFPNNWKLIGDIGIFYFKKGLYKKAKGYFLKLTQLSPNNDYAYWNLAAAEYALGNIEAAISITKEAISIRPSGYAYSNLGTMLFYKEKYVEASQAFSKAVELNKTNYINWGNLGDAYRLIGDSENKTFAYQKAVTAAESALELNPNNNLTKAVLAYYLANLEQRDKALFFAAQIGEQNTGTENFTVAMAYDSLNLINESLKHIEFALSKKYPADEIRNSPLLPNSRTSERFKTLTE